MTGPGVLTIILNYKTAEMTLDSVRAALREMAGIAGEIIVVDNDSRDGSFEALTAAVATEGWTGRVRVLAAGHNGGYGAGNNVGIRAGFANGERPDYVYILNSDAFPDPGAIRVLVDYLERHPAVGFAGSYIHGPDGEPHMTAFRFPTLLGELEGATRMGPVSRLLADHVVPLPVPEETRPVDWLAGASVMARRTMLDEIGLFDEQFFLYYEETDLCRRANRAGWPTIYVRESSVTHIGSVSTGAKGWKRVPGYWLDSRLHYFTKNHGPAYAAGATLVSVLGGLLWRGRRFLQGEPNTDPPYLQRDLVTHCLRAPFRRAKPAPRPAQAAIAAPDTP
ncbi:glycosyltransferase family 2 protein [uncultured Amaricoccus sp.]|uniref:glycosyltransferase family 2 protein n=1 Tax=uncultured Amaricoccus sp. TaxID=339341 RepID=UPI00261CC7B9|nr:glycosyltransferase family 2 protein [uncultured Amaricoccus sp.]